MSKVKPKKVKKKIVESIDILEEYGTMSIAEMIKLLESQQAKYPDTILELEAYSEDDYYCSASCAKLTMHSHSMVEN